MDKIIFLDIDGPIIPYTSFLFNKNASYDQELDPRCCAVLRKIIDASGAKIVFNTTHNTMLEPDEGRKIPGLLKQFELAGFSEDIHPTVCTDFPNTSRMEAIDNWLSKNKTENMLWIALDDANIDHKRACLVDADLGIGLREYNFAAKWLMFKSFFVL